MRCTDYTFFNKQIEFTNNFEFDSIFDRSQTVYEHVSCLYIDVDVQVDVE